MSVIDWASIKSEYPEFDGEVSPESGSRILFFSGGSAIREISSCLALSTERSIHIITTFDSGGSSAALRQALNMPAVGDLRSRISALADFNCPGVSEALKLWAYRMERGGHPAQQRKAFSDLASGAHPYIRTMPGELARAMLPMLAEFAAAMPHDFDLRGACIGNLMLAGGCLRFGSMEDSVKYFSGLFKVRGVVMPVTEEAAHLAVRYGSGRVCVGQHAFSGKAEDAAAGGRGEEIRSIWFTAGLEDAAPISVRASESALRQIHCADLICYPPGSFFSSLVANLMPVGVGRSVAANPCPKVSLPNPGADKELAGLDLRRQVEIIVGTLAADGAGVEPSALLDAVLLDTRNGVYGDIPYEWLAERGIALLDCDLAEPSGSPFVKAAPQKAAALLMHIARRS